MLQPFSGTKEDLTKPRDRAASQGTGDLRRGSILGVAGLAILLVAGVPARASEKSQAPVPAETVALMREKNMAPEAPVLLRVYKKEAALEVWKQTRSGRYAFLKSFPICRWSGQLGPKTKTGDRQAPEGFYTVAERQLNPNSKYHLSFDTGFPNAYDKAHGASGSALMVHGTCSSAGCYAMTDAGVGEIYALVRDALAGGQPAFQFQAFPFRMTAENVAKHRGEPHYGFWRQLKEGSDRFEATGEEPKVTVIDGRYAFKSRSPSSDGLAAERIGKENDRIATLVTNGAASIRTTYSDGGQNAIFAALLKKGANLGDVSRPEALAYAGKEVVITPARKVVPKPMDGSAPTVVAGAIPDVPRAMQAAPIVGAALMLDSGLKPLPEGTRLVVSVVRVRSQTAPPLRISFAR